MSESKTTIKASVGDTLILRNGGKEVCTAVGDHGFQSACHHWHPDGHWTVIVENSMDIVGIE